MKLEILEIIFKHYNSTNSPLWLEDIHEYAWHMLDMTDENTSRCVDSLIEDGWISVSDREKLVVLDNTYEEYRKSLRPFRHFELLIGDGHYVDTEINP